MNPALGRCSAYRLAVAAIAAPLADDQGRKGDGSHFIREQAVFLAGLGDVKWILGEEKGTGVISFVSRRFSWPASGT